MPDFIAINQITNSMRKINSDMDGEPLNYTDYIYDISVFGLKSYVMNPNNSVIWDELALKSCYLYGHTEIKDYVYERLTEQNIDNLFNDSNNKLGRQLNNFISNKVYAEGNVSSVLRNMTQSVYNNMIEKFKLGMQRYCENKFVNGNLGQWLNTIFNLNLSNYNTIDDILNDDDAWEIFITNEAALVCFSSSHTAVTKMSQCTKAIERLGSCINYASQNMEAIKSICHSDIYGSYITNNEICMTNIANSEEGMKELLKHQPIIEAALSSELSMTVFGNSLTAVTVICEFLANIQISTNSLNTIMTALETINSNKDKIYEGTYLTDYLQEAKSIIEEAINISNQTTNVCTAIDQMSTLIFTNPIFLNQIINNENIMNNIFANKKMLLAMYNNYKIVEPILSTSPYFNSATKNSPYYTITTKSGSCSYFVGSDGSYAKTKLSIYFGKCFIIGVSQSYNAGNISSRGTVLYNLLSGTLLLPSTTHNSYTESQTEKGLKCKVNKFANNLEMIPFANFTSNSTANSTIEGSVAYIKID